MASQLLVSKIQLSTEKERGLAADCLFSSKTSNFSIFQQQNQRDRNQSRNMVFLIKNRQPTARKLGQKLLAMVRTSAESLGAENTRRSTDFTPSIWADCFISNQQVINAATHEHEKLKEEVGRIIVGLHDSPTLQPKLILIDTLQRLGIFYHFETEMEDILQSVHQHHVYDGDDNCNDLLSVALLFRLLRQERIYVSPDIFKKFQDDKGHFKESLIHDIGGILALYEASFLGMHGELILDKAQAFAITHLKSSIAMDTCPPELLEQVNHALDVPFHWNFARLEARHYILVYKQNMSKAHEETLLKFAALDFNIVQALHYNEISQITRWWKELNTIKTPRFIRSRVVEYFFMALMVYFQPDYSEARILAVKLIHLITPIDDAYDNYGTMKELELFMDAIERLDPDYIDMLPEYMKLIFNNLLIFLGEVEQRTKEQPYIIFHIKKELKRLVRGFLDEAKWSYEEHEPTVEEYMKVATITIGGTMLPVIYFTLMGVHATEKVFQWVASLPRIVEAAAIISRIMDDLAPSKVETLYLPTAVKCYIKQYGVSEKHAKAVLNDQVKNAWKDINEELIKGIGTTMPKPILMHILNCAREGYIFGKIGDLLENPDIAKTIISSLFIDPIIV